MNVEHTGSQFWMVWNPNAGPPRFKHPNACLAIAEAERLASQHPGQEFYVSKATHMRVTDNMRRVELQRPTGLAADEIEPPF